MESRGAKIWLISQGVTQRDICNAIPGLSAPFLSMLLAGRRKSDARLNDIATYLGIDRPKLDRLIGGKKGDPRAKKRTIRGQRPAVPLSRSAAPPPGPAHAVPLVVASEG